MKRPSTTTEYKMNEINIIDGQSARFDIDEKNYNMVPVSHDDNMSTQSHSCYNPNQKVLSCKTAKKNQFSIAQKGCKGRRTKHMLNYDQITYLENLYFKDPSWKSATV